MAFQEHGLNEDTVDVVSHFIGGTPIEIQVNFEEVWNAEHEDIMQ